MAGTGAVAVGTSRRQLAAIAALLLAAFWIQLTTASPAQAANFTGTFGPTIVSELADLNGDGVVDGMDDSNEFYGSTSIIDGGLDCNAWTADNDGAAGDLTIDGNDDCTLIGFDGTPDGVTIEVVDGRFQVLDGPLPHVFNATDPDNPSVVDSNFAWQTINGRVDSNGNGQVNANDCHIGIIGTSDTAGLGPFTSGVHILGDTADPGTNPCGFGVDPANADDGRVDLNGDIATTTADSCDGCFFGLDLVEGFVQEPEPKSLELTPPTETNTVGTDHTVTAHVEDTFADPFVGVTVRFTVAGVHTTSGSDVTDASGNATFTYTGANAGADTITAFADTDESGTKEAAEPGGTAMKTWEAGPPPPDTCPGFESDPRNHVVGTAGPDNLEGTTGNDIICGLGSADLLLGRGGNDLLLGNAGDDVLEGGTGADEIRGGGGRDDVFGARGNDDLFGNRGNDAIFGGRGRDHLDGGPGRRDLCRGGPGRDHIVRCER